MNSNNDLAQLSDLPLEVENFANVGVWHYYTTSNKISWSASLHKIYEVEEHEFQGTFEDYIKYLHPDDVESVKSTIDNAIKDNSSFSFDKRIITANGNSKYVRNWGIVLRNANNKAVQVSFLSMDITSSIKSEIALKESEAFNKKLVENTPNAILVEDVNSKILFANSTCAKLLKAPSADYLIGKNASEFRLNTTKKDMHQTMLKILESGKASPKLEIDYKCLDGSVKTGEFVAVPFEYKNQPAVLVIVNDITQQKKAFKDVESSEKQLLHFIENTPAAVAMYDRNMNYLTCSEQFIRDWWVSKTPISPKDIVGKNHYKIFTDTKKEWREIHARVLAGETLKEDNDSFVKKNGKKEWLQWKAQPWYKGTNEIGGLILFTEFITERKEAEHAIQQSRNRLNALIHALPDLLLILKSDGNLLDIQASYESLLFEPLDELLGKNIRTFLEPDDGKEFIRKSELAISTGENQLIEYSIDVSKVKRYYEARIVKYESDKVLAVIRDITKHKQDEAQLIELTEELSASNAELKQFAYITSHDLRSPVVNLDTLLKFYQTEGISKNDKEELLEKIVSSVDQLKSTLNDLIQLVSIKDHTHLELTQVDLIEIIEAVINGLETQINAENAEVNYDLSDQRFVCSRKATVFSIVQNLISNALKYRSEENPVIDISTTETKDYVILTIKDNGLGIDLEKHGKKLFGMYQRFHENKDGKGLGLYIIKSQIEAMGGSIEVDSEVGKGTEFKVSFKN